MSSVFESEGVKNFLKDLVAGGFSGIIAKTIIAPIERVKILLQTQYSNARIQKGQHYRGASDCVRHLYQNEGFFAFWRGNVANVMRYFPNQALNFALKDKFRSLLTLNDDTNKYAVVATNFLSGGAAGGTSMLILYPLDVARTRMATDVLQVGQKDRQFSGVFDSVYKSYKEGGITRLYRGFVVAVSGAMFFRALFFGGYDNAKYSLDLENAPLSTRYLVAQTLTTTVGTICYPLDTLKRRMMIQVDFVHPEEGVKTTYMNGRECVRYILKTEGVKGFFAGLSVNILRGVSGAVLLVVYDDVKKLLAT